MGLESEQHPNRNILISLTNLPAIPEGEPSVEIVTADYVNLELGIPLLDYHGGKIWLGSAIAIASAVTVLGYIEYQREPIIQQNLQCLLPYVIGALCCAPAAFPVAGFLWAFYQDTVNY